MTLWEVDIYPADRSPDSLAQTVSGEAADLHLAEDLQLSAARGFLIEGDVSADEMAAACRDLLVDAIVERSVVAPVGDATLNRPPSEFPTLIHVLPKPGVMDPVAESARAALAGLGLDVAAVRTLRKYWFPPLPEDQLDRICRRLLANDAVEQVIRGPLKLERLEVGSPQDFELITVPLRKLNEAGLEELSRDRQLYLTLVEMQTIQRHFRELGRDPTDVELETLAQTWSEHCSHKTLAGRIAYRDEQGEQQFDNMLRQTIFAATEQIRRRLGEDDWCVSVFEDNAGVVRFDDHWDAAIKVETHNHPSALEPYGGANTGIGGVIRDILGTGLGAKPVCNTDVFCFAPPDVEPDDLPPGVLHPRRVMKGVVAGVRDYGNRMGIPTVNGAVYFDPRYLGNPLVYCGNVGIIPRGKTKKSPQPGDLIVAIGGRTGRDGIHGATFSSAELTSESEELSGGAVQIGNAITEKIVLDVLMQARDRGLFTAVTDCGAGGFSSAVGEMGEDLGAEVWLERPPLKYEGLSYDEIWISEAQERMVVSVPESNWEDLDQLCRDEQVQATVIGRFDPQQNRRLVLKYQDVEVGNLSMEFLHDGRPPVVRDAVYRPPPAQPLRVPEEIDFGQTLLQLLSSLNIASKHWIIRQYDHEVQGGSAIKPLVGIAGDGPSDAAVIRPVLGSRRGLVVACGMNPHYGDLDTYHMAASGIDEAMRNCVAVGADPSRIALLDNFCWGYTDRAETLGSLVRAALACRDLSVGLGAPFVSGKDSLNNEFSYIDDAGQKQTLSIPSTLLITAMGQVADVAQCVTMDLKSAGSLLYLVGETRNELGGSHFALLHGLAGGNVPQVDAATAKATFAAVHRAIAAGTVRACHDLSEGGLAVAAAEMCFAGGLGAEIYPFQIAAAGIDEGTLEQQLAALLFSESNTRFLCEVPPDRAGEFEKHLREVPLAQIGEVTDTGRFEVLEVGEGVEEEDKTFEFKFIDIPIADLKAAWLAPLDW